MTPPGTTPPTVVVQISRRAIVLFAGLILLPWVVCFVWVTRPKAPATEKHSTPADSLASSAIVKCKPGPWGELQYTRILIEPPEEQVVANYPLIDHADWTFEDYDRTKLEALWQEAGLSPAERETINAPQRWKVEDRHIVISAPRDFVLHLSPHARSVIYAALAEFKANPAQCEPFRYRADRSDEWFADSGLSHATIAQVRKLLYRQGNSLLFCDQALFIPTINVLAERVHLIKTLARKSTLLVTLRIRPDTDIDALNRYWGRGSRSRDIRPLLQSLPQVKGGIDIDIIHLLPRFARSLLYTYPAPDDPGSTTYLDCHWTVLNFFNAVPDERYKNTDAVSAAFQQNYHPVTGAPTFGDIFLFVKPNGEVIHSCVYIADDIVFTKNGASATSPWILMTLTDTVAFYPSSTPLDIQHYRSRHLPDS